MAIPVVYCIRGDQTELREVFDQRSIAHYFNGGIYGSPKDKHSIVRDLLKSKQIQHPGLFLGDSRLDHEVARAFGFDFIFINQWTEFSDWRLYCRSNRIQSVTSIIDILDLEASGKIKLHLVIIDSPNAVFSKPFDQLILWQSYDESAFPNAVSIPLLVEKNECLRSRYLQLIHG